MIAPRTESYLLRMSRRNFIAKFGGAAAATWLAGCDSNHLLPPVNTTSSGGSSSGGSSSGGTGSGGTGSGGTGSGGSSSGGTGSGGSSSGDVAANSLFHYVTTGQSLSTGTQGAPSISTTQPFSNLMFTYPVGENPAYLNDPLSFNAVTLGFDDIAFRSLINGPSSSGANGSIETIANGFADSLTAQAPAYQQLMSCSGVGGTAYAGLAGPTDYPPSGSPPFQEMMSQVRTGMALATEAGLSYSVPAMLVIHGEFDGYNDDYSVNLKTWQADTERGINALTGVSESVPMIAAQTQALPGSEGNFNTLPFHPNAGPLGTLAAAVANPSAIFVACPEYMMTHHYYEDAEGNPDPTGQPIHMTADGYRHLGLMMAKAAYAVCLQKTSWLPLMPSSFVAVSNVITIGYTVPYRPLVIDTSYVSDPGFYGFSYADGNGTVITAVQLSGDAEVTVTLSAACPGGWLAYALVDPGPAGGAPYGQGFGPTAGPRGCLRDSDPTVSYYQNSKTGLPYPMQNYCVMWQQYVAPSS